MKKMRFENLLISRILFPGMRTDSPRITAVLKITFTNQHARPLIPFGKVNLRYLVEDGLC